MPAIPDGLAPERDATLRIWDATPLIERDREVRAAELQRTRMRPRVEQLLEQLGDPARVAAALRTDPSLAPDQRRAALRVLLAICAAPR